MPSHELDLEDEEEINCERCGGEMGNRLIGDESWNFCGDCGNYG